MRVLLVMGILPHLLATLERGALAAALGQGGAPRA